MLRKMIDVFFWNYAIVLKSSPIILPSDISADKFGVTSTLWESYSLDEAWKMLFFQIPDSFLVSHFKKNWSPFRTYNVWNSHVDYYYVFYLGDKIRCRKYISQPSTQCFFRLYMFYFGHFWEKYEPTITMQLNLCAISKSSNSPIRLKIQRFLLLYEWKTSSWDNDKSYFSIFCGFQSFRVCLSPI